MTTSRGMQTVMYAHPIQNVVSTKIRGWKRLPSLQRFLASKPKRKIGRKAFSIGQQSTTASQLGEPKRKMSSEDEFYYDELDHYDLTDSDRYRCMLHNSNKLSYYCTLNLNDFIIMIIS